MAYTTRAVKGTNKSTLLHKKTKSTLVSNAVLLMAAEIGSLFAVFCNPACDFRRVSCFLIRVFTTLWFEFLCLFLSMFQTLGSNADQERAPDTTMYREVRLIIRAKCQTICCLLNGTRKSTKLVNRNIL